MEAAAFGVVVALAVVIGLDSLRRARTRQVSPAEERVFRLFNNRPDAIHIPVWAVMQSGSLAAVFVVAGGVWLRGEHPDTVVVFAVGFAAWAGVKEVKRFVGRGRPSAHLGGVNVRGEAQTGLGYPSGHSAVSLTLALSATSGMGVGVSIAAVGVALFTGGARMYVGAHLPIDVVGGLSIGTVVGLATRLALG